MGSLKLIITLLSLLCLCLLNKFNLLEGQILLLPQIRFSNYLSDFTAIKQTLNYLFSPFNLELALSVLNVGTKRCDVRIYGLTDKSDYSEIRRVMGLLREIKRDGNLTLNINNDLYAKSDVQLNEAYARVVKDVFGAFVGSVDFRFNLESVIGTINQRISDNTNGLIKDFVKTDQVDPYIVLMSVNSLYFKGTWKEPFNKDMEKFTFFGESGSKSIDMLKGEDMKLLVNKNDLLKAKIIVKDFYREDFKLILLIPINKTIQLSLVETNLIKYPQGLFDGIANAREIVSNLYIPKIDEEFEISILDMLSEELKCWRDYGIDNIVEGSELTVSRINHKVKLEITAEGSEGAAVVESDFGYRTLHFQKPSLCTEWGLQSNTCKIILAPIQWSLKRNMLSLKLNQILEIDYTMKDRENGVQSTSHKQKKITPLQQKASLISKKIDSLNINGALKLISTNDTLAESNLETLIKLRSKHPTTTFMPILPQPFSHCAADFTQEEVRKAILSFHRDSAHGLDGIRPIFLQDITSPVICTQVSILTKITNLVNKILNGDVLSFITPLLFGARLIALQKPNKDIRPIAIGSTYHRLVAKLIASRIKHDAAHILSPYQLGVGIPGGCEAAVHLTRIHLENNPKNESLVKIDFSNAYNTLSRNTFLHSTCFHFPAYTKFLFSCYQSPTILQFNKEKILSVEGIQQGDPLGSILFSLGINDMIKSINSSCTLSLHAWYIDDGILSGPSSEIAKAVTIIKEMGTAIGLSLNQSKSEFSLLNSNAPNTHDFKFTSSVELTHLGSPVGGHEAISTFLHSTLDILLKLEDIFTLLPSHNKYQIQRNRLGPSNSSNQIWWSRHQIST
ncbi:uncharacterized protein LOC135923246 [Gordionus sp. m RMFG-2023]|uniref:uncharacterized protein LOC135923246 n=1 Tax=Gordionus sp. m RMFG-2023 TaxID=3053472 RepID=UPI0031FCF60A